jgi:hypothetical protein
MASQMMSKLLFISKMHGKVSKNNFLAQVRQKQAYASWRGKKIFSRFKEGKTFVKMKKPCKKKSLASNWEEPYLFVRYLDGHGFLEQDEGAKVCVMKVKNEKLWDKP